jgi:predicted small secreted protein
MDMKKLLMLLVLVIVTMSATSCHMLHGAGQDVENAGDAVQDAVN